MIAGINMFLARLRLILLLYYHYITIIISLKGNIRHKNIKIECKHSNSRLSANCIYFVEVLTTNCLFKKQKKRKSFSKYKKKNEK